MEREVSFGGRYETVYAIRVEMLGSYEITKKTEKKINEEYKKYIKDCEIIEEGNYEHTLSFKFDPNGEGGFLKEYMLNAFKKIGDVIENESEFKLKKKSWQLEELPLVLFVEDKSTPLGKIFIGEEKKA